VELVPLVLMNAADWLCPTVVTLGHQALTSLSADGRYVTSSSGTPPISSSRATATAGRTRSSGVAAATPDRMTHFGLARPQVVGLGNREWSPPPPGLRGFATRTETPPRRTIPMRS
jgi:hypothetical protein